MNIFSVLDESDDEEQTKVVDKKPVAKKDGAKKDTPVAAKPAPVGAKPVAKATETKKDTASAKDNKPKPTGDKTKAPAAKSAPAVEGEEAVAGKDNNRGGHARGRDNKGGRGGRGHGVPESAEGQTRVKREFDRRSGTGRGREVSKGGRGAFGFGNPAQDALEAEKNPEGAEATLGPVDGEEAAEPEVVAEPEPVVFGLDEFLEKRNEQRRALNAQETKLRSVDKSALAGLTKKEDETDLLYMADKVKAAKAEAARKDQRSTGKQQVLDVAFKFESVQVDDREERRGGRGGRGGARESTGRGGGRGRGSRPATGGNNAKPTTVFSNLDFPTL